MKGKTDHLPQVKKVTAKRLPPIKAELTHCLFVDEESKIIAGLPNVGIKDLTRVVTKAGLKKLFPVEMAILMVDKEINVLDVVKARISSMDQFAIAVGYLDKDKKSKELEKEVA